MQMKYSAAICPYCGTGCSLNLVVTDEGISGHAPYHRSPVNRGKLCTKGLHAAKSVGEYRITKALVNGEEVSDETAFAEALKLKNYSDMEVYVSTRLTNEAIYAASRLAKETFGCAAVKTLNDAVCAKSTVKLNDIKNADAVLVIDDCMKKLPLSCNTIFTTQANGAKVYYAGQTSYSSVQADEAAILEDAFAIPANFTEALKAAAKPVVVCLAGSQYAKDAAAYAAEQCLPFAELFETNNGRGAVELGCVPSYTGFKNAETVPKALLIFAECPEFDTEMYVDLLPQLEKVEHLVVIASTASVLTDIANVVIPVTGFGEYEGTVTNWEGRVQKTKIAVVREDVHTPCEVVRELSGGAIAYENSSIIIEDIKANIPQYAEIGEIGADGVFIKEA